MKPCKPADNLQCQAFTCFASVPLSVVGMQFVKEVVAVSAHEVGTCCGSVGACWGSSAWGLLVGRLGTVCVAFKDEFVLLWKGMEVAKAKSCPFLQVLELARDPTNAHDKWWAL